MLPASSSVLASLACAFAFTGCAALVGADFDGLHAPILEDASTPDPLDATAPADASQDVASRDATSDVGPKPSDAAQDAVQGDAHEGGPTAKKIVFVTSSLFTANLGGIAGADVKCQASAVSGGLSGTFRAWISDEGTSATAGLTHASIPYALVTGTVVAANWSALASGSLAHAIDRNELGGAPPATTGCGSTSVFTGTDTTGASSVGHTCSGWTTAVAAGLAGLGDATGATYRWTNSCTGACSGLASLYCLEQ